MSQVSTRAPGTGGEDRITACARLLNNLLACEARSLFRYLVNQTPYTDRQALGLRRVVEEIAEAGKTHEAILTEMVRALRRKPQEGSYALADTYINDNTWQHLVPFLLESKERQIERYEQGLSLLHRIDPKDTLDCQAMLDQFLLENRVHLEHLSAAVGSAREDAAAR